MTNLTNKEGTWDVSSVIKMGGRKKEEHTRGRPSLKDFKIKAKKQHTIRKTN